MKPCKLWTGARDSNGYGMMRFAGVVVRVSRFTLIEFTAGPIQQGMFACHRCDNPSCYEQEHLFWGTQQDNIADMVAKSRHKGGTVGVLHRAFIGAKLKDEQVREILSSTKTYRELAIQFKVSRQTISNIKNRKSYLDVTI